MSTRLQSFWKLEGEAVFWSPLDSGGCSHGLAPGLSSHPRPTVLVVFLHDITLALLNPFLHFRTHVDMVGRPRIISQSTPPDSDWQVHRTPAHFPLARILQWFCLTPRQIAHPGRETSSIPTSCLYLSTCTRQVLQRERASGVHVYNERRITKMAFDT